LFNKLNNKIKISFFKKLQFLNNHDKVVIYFSWFEVGIVILKNNNN